MEIAVLSDAVSSIAYSTQLSGLSDLFLNRSHNAVSVTDASSEQGTQSPPSFQVSAMSRPATRTMKKPRLRKARRVKRKILVGDDGEDDLFYVLNDNGGGGYFGYGNGGGGRGWNFGGHGWGNWEEFSDSSIPDPAFDVAYKLIGLIAMSRCFLFAVKRVIRFASDGFGGRGKVPMQLPQVC